MPGSVAQQVIAGTLKDGSLSLDVEHPTGFFTVELDVSGTDHMQAFAVKRAALLRTARLLMRGEVLVSQNDSGSDA
jgi:4-oxalomesaconate tautomerase